MVPSSARPAPPRRPEPRHSAVPLQPSWDGALQPLPRAREATCVLEANFCLLGKVALASPPPFFLFFSSFLFPPLLLVAKHFLAWPASAEMLCGLRSVAGIEIVTLILGGRPERATLIIALVQQRQGLRRILGIRTRVWGRFYYRCPPLEGKCFLFLGCSGRPVFDRWHRSEPGTVWGRRGVWGAPKLP